MKHPADLNAEERAVYNTGFSHFDTLILLGYTTDDVRLYVQGIRERMQMEEWKALHPQFFEHKRST